MQSCARAKAGLLLSVFVHSCVPTQLDTAYAVSATEAICAVLGSRFTAMCKRVGRENATRLVRAGTGGEQ